MLKDLLEKVKHLPGETKVYLSYHPDYQKREDVETIYMIASGEVFQNWGNEPTRVTLDQIRARDFLMIDIDDGFVYTDAKDVIEKDYGVLLITQ